MLIIILKILFFLPSLSQFKVKKIYLNYINRFLEKVVFTPTLNYRILAVLTPNNHIIKLIDEK